MKIGFLINTCEPFYRGGYERRAWTFARELARQGHEVRIYTSCPHDEIIDGVHFIPLGPARIFFNARGVRNGWADVLFAFNVLKLFWKISAHELDVLDICATPFLHLQFAAFVCHLKKIPAVLTCHEALLASLPAYAKERGHANPVTTNLVTKILAGIYRLGTGLFPRRIAVSHRTAAALEKEGYPAQATIEFGLEPEAFSSALPVAPPTNSPVRFVYCGRLTPIKNVFTTIQALSSLKKENFHFDIIGDGSERLALEEAVLIGGVENKVIFHGNVSESAKRVLLAQSEVFILSSPREGFSIATLEAMAQGCAALVVTDPQHPNGVLDFVHDQEQGLVASPGPKAMSEALGTLLANAPLRLSVRRSAWQAAQLYRIENQAQKLVDVYRLP